MKQCVYKNFVINPTKELTFTYRISPLSNDKHFMDFTPLYEKYIKDMHSYLKNRFGNYCFTEKGRTAIYKALNFYNLQKKDLVTILTTSGNSYISSCVIREIEKFCLWSREITSATKLIFVNHEFGYPYSNLFELKRLGLPIIEDCAYTFFSQDANQSIGKVGDFVIYSLPKAFSMQMGGILVSNKYSLNSDDIPIESINYIEHRLALCLRRIDEIIQKRIDNYQYLVFRLAQLNIKPFFQLSQSIVPGVFLFRWDKNIDYPNLKDFMQRNGIESSVFYGENAFFIPVHDSLEKNDLDYFSVLLEFYYKSINNIL